MDKIIGVLKEHEAGTPVSETCRKHGVSDAGIYKMEGQVRRCSETEVWTAGTWSFWGSEQSEQFQYLPDARKPYSRKIALRGIGQP